MRIAQITDLHIAAEGEKPYDVDVRERFVRALGDVADQSVDLIVLTGDLCYREGNASVYRWILDKLRGQQTPFYVLPGNHDDTALLAETFGLQEWLREGKLWFVRELEGVHTLFLDTADNTLSPEQAHMLTGCLHDGEYKELMIFMHHPPVLAGVRYMDKNYPLLNSDAISRLILDSGKGVTVFCGHYHVDKTVRAGNMRVFLGPSTFVQIDQQADRFKVDHKRMGWRIIDVHKGSLLTGVRYMPEEA